MVRRQATFEPFQSYGTVRFFLQRPTGYMSAYSLRGALASTRASLRIRGSRDPLYVSLLGRNPIRLPALRGPVTPRKTRCTGTRRDGHPCTALVWGLLCSSHQRQDVPA